jgi:hypothetical protein
MTSQRTPLTVRPVPTDASVTYLPRADLVLTGGRQHHERRQSQVVRVHALVHPMAGRSPHSILGFWSSLGFYAHYDGEMSRNRLVAILLMPLLTRMNLCGPCG